MAQREQILAALRKLGPSQAWQVGIAVGMELAPVSEEMRGMVAGGLLTRDRSSGRTLWSVAESAEAAAAEVLPAPVRGAVEGGPVVEATAEPLPDPVAPRRGRFEDPPADALTIRHAIGAMVLVFAEAEQRIRACFAEMVETEQRLRDVFGGYMSIEAGHHCANFTNPDDTIKNLRRSAYQRLAEKLEIRRAMSIKAAGELDERLGIRRGQLTVQDFPELTEANVWKFFEPYAVSIPQMFEEALREVFNWLRPRGDSKWDRQYKTNEKSLLVLDEKLVLTGIVSHGYGNERWRLSDWSGPRMLALENVFSMLDGKGGIAKTYRGAVSDAIGATKDNTFDTRYMRGRVWGNGNMHVRFKRMDLVRELNRRAGGMNLRPGPEEESVADLFAELRAGIEGVSGLDDVTREDLIERVDRASFGMPNAGAARIWARDLVWPLSLKEHLPHGLLLRLGIDPPESHADPEEEASEPCPPEEARAHA